MGIRTTAELKQKIEDAAMESGRSLAQEIELRLERSFDEDVAHEITREIVKDVIAAARSRAEVALAKDLADIKKTVQDLLKISQSGKKGIE
jgi:hypothetical protein